jgi:release factor glutamine methyltransferase
LYTRFDQVPAAESLTKFREWVRRRAAGEPVAYLVEQKEFFALPLAVSRDVLIPRPETELLVVETLDRAKRLGTGVPPRIADVGTGSGNVAIALAKHLPQARIWAVDLSPEALAVARRNAAALGVEQQIEFVQGDLLQPLAGGEPFDFVVSNPPYIGTAERESLPVSVREYEPAEALFSSGPLGTEIVERLVVEAQRDLRPGGFLLVEISPIIAARVREFFGRQSGWSQTAIKKDLAGLDRVAIAQKAAAG